MRERKASLPIKRQNPHPLLLESPGVGTASGVVKHCSKARKAVADARSGRTVRKHACLMSLSAFTQSRQLTRIMVADRLIGNPWVAPPEPRDWEVRPTHPAREVPYRVASSWDERRAQANMKAVSEARRAAQIKSDPFANVPRDLRQKLKRSRGAKGLLQDLEEQVREFVEMWEAKERHLQRQGLADAEISDEEEIVFVGRNGQMRDLDSPQTSRGTLQRDKLVFDSLVDDHGASFG